MLFHFNILFIPLLFSVYLKGENTDVGSKLSMYPLKYSLCNDGSPATYYFAPSFDYPQNKLFVIHLPGGAQCFDSVSCLRRYNGTDNKFMSSRSNPENIYKTGILDDSPSRSPLWHANKVYISYCSSDAFMGNLNRNTTLWGWHFMGQQIVFETIRELRTHHHLDDSSTVVLSGSSAGARGLMVLLDVLVSSHLPSGCRVVGVLDSPYYINISPYTPAFEGLVHQTIQIYQNMNTSGVIPDACHAQYKDASWKCLFGQYRMPFVQTPHMLLLSPYDSYQLSNNLGATPPYHNESMYEYANQFADKTKREFRLLIRSKSEPQNTASVSSKGYAYYSWNCYNHALSLKSGFYASSTEDGVSPKDALERFLASEPTKHRNIFVWMDQCPGFACGAGCVCSAELIPPSESTLISNGAGFFLRCCAVCVLCVLFLLAVYLT